MQNKVKFKKNLKKFVLFNIIVIVMVILLFLFKLSGLIIIVWGISGFFLLSLLLFDLLPKTSLFFVYFFIWFLIFSNVWFYFLSHENKKTRKRAWLIFIIYAVAIYIVSFMVALSLSFFG